MAATCKHCGKPLVLNTSKRCWGCGRPAHGLRRMRAGHAYTAKGANRLYARAERREARARRSLFTGPRAGSPSLAPSLHGMSWQQAEAFACQWMHKHGYRDAAVTPAGPDGGVDVRARKAVGQVKHQAAKVGIQEVQRLSGIAAAEGRRALLFTASGVTPAALRWANAHHVECYTYPPMRRL